MSSRSTSGTISPTPFASRRYLRGERTEIGLVAKSLLAWQIFAGGLGADSRERSSADGAVAAFPERLAQIFLQDADVLHLTWGFAAAAVSMALQWHSTSVLRFRFR